MKKILKKFPPWEWFAYLGVGLLAMALFVASGGLSIWGSLR